MLRLGLIGNSGHWQEYVPILRDIEGARISAVAPGDPDDPAERFDTAPGVTGETARHASYQDLLSAADVDAVQVCVRPHRTTAVVAECLHAGIPVMADKPLAADERQLATLWQLHRDTGVTVAATHMYRATPCFAVAHELVREGRMGDVVAGHCQLSFRWGDSRPDWFRRRGTFPGTFAFIGVHVMDTLYWILGDRFQSATGQQTAGPHPDYPACATSTTAIVTLDNGASLTVAANFLRPAGASSHGELRLHLAGTDATVDLTDRREHTLALTDTHGEPTIQAPDIPYWYTTFAKHVMGHGKPFMTTEQVLRVTELALRVQRAIDTGERVDLATTQISSP